jgi:hypothetical protein
MIIIAAACALAISEETLFYICSSEKPASFSELLFHKKGPQGKTGISDCKSNTPKHKGKDRQIAQGDYEQERAK